MGIEVGKILRSVKPNIYFFKVESDDPELLLRMQEEVRMTAQYYKIR